MREIEVKHGDVFLYHGPERENAHIHSYEVKRLMKAIGGIPGGLGAIVDTNAGQLAQPTHMQVAMIPRHRRLLLIVS